MKLIFIMTILFSVWSLADTECIEPTDGSKVFKCDKITSSEIVGRKQDKIQAAAYAVWLQNVDGQVGFCADGAQSASNTIEPGKSFSIGASNLVQLNQKLEKMWSKKVEVSEESWTLAIENSPEVLKLYPNYPPTYNHYHMDLKSLELSVSEPTGLKSFGTIKLSCKPKGK